MLQLQERPLPVPKPGWVLIRVKAFGLNRSELFTRQGHSGKAVEFPRILGIEAVGVVEAAPKGAFTPGQTVATAMGGPASTTTNTRLFTCTHQDTETLESCCH